MGCGRDPRLPGADARASVSAQVIRFEGTVDLRLYRRACWLALGGKAVPWVLGSLAAALLVSGLALLGLGRVLDGLIPACAGLLGALSLAVQEAAIR